MTPVFELNHLQVSLRGKKRNTDLVKGVSFSVKPGECLGILGESGSGKSMSIKAAMGLLDKNFVVSGSAKFQGDELVGKNAEQLRRLRGGQVGIVLQNPMTCFDPLYRIGNQIAETFAAHQKWDAGEIKERSIEMLDKMQIRNPEEALEKYPHQLSGGMLQRIMIGIAMSMEPSLLIADEPTTAIDAITQFDILNEFAAIKQKHKTAMIFISHDLNAVSQIADKIVVLNQGTVVDQGDFHHIIHHAADPYTRLLIEKRTDVMRKYRQALEGGECSHAQAG
ncbi:ABC transporter ATP-binding protein [Clostridium sp. AT4]|uniref:ABC transporter ATP-binding protein n=1 Tax=Clostridium sp. AT4 TaxID=1720194 RepID=UPI000835179F|nr:ABC transporter ATP-binding protein [Clostridium sp. AT4]MBD9077422.1 ABC transporter ATP-binding protein [Clostridium sp.]